MGQDLITINDARVKFKGEWVVIEVTQSDVGTPVEGILLAHDPDESLVTELAANIVRDRDPRPKVAFFWCE